MKCILTSNAIVYTNCADAIYVDDDGHLCVDTPTGVMRIKGQPDNALAQIAMAEAEDKGYIEFEDSELIIGEADED